LEKLASAQAKTIKKNRKIDFVLPVSWHREHTG